MTIDCSQFLIIILALCYARLSASAVYHITNSTNAPCPEEPCLTLPQFATYVEIYLESSTTLVFLPGNHHLDLYINISAVSNFSMLSNSTSLDRPRVTILCEPHAGMNFSSIDSIYVGYMRFVGCRGHQAISVESFVVDNATFTYHSESAFQFVSSGVEITRTSFISNSGGSLHNISFGLELTPEDLWLISIVGKSYEYPETGAAIAVTRSTVVISDCVFEANQAQI